MEVEPNWRIGRIKKELQVREGISVPQQRFLFGAQNLADQTTVEAAKIKSNDVIHMVLFVRGGK